MIDNLFPCDIGVLVTIQEAIIRLRTIVLVSTLTLGLLAGPLPAEAQQAGKVYRVGYISSGSPATNSGYIATLQGLRELGYVEGKNIIIEYRSRSTKRTHGHRSTKRFEHSLKMAAELVRLKVDVIVVSHAPPDVRAAQRATRTIPIVMGGIHVDPVKAGFVVSLARPGGNITGLTNLAWKLHAKQLELLKEAFPRISRVAIMWRSPHQKQATKEIKAVAQALGIQIQPLVVTGRPMDEYFDSAFSAISREHSDGLLVGFARSYSAIPSHARMIEFAVKRRLPTIYAGSGFAKAGGLMSYSADGQHLSRRAATYVDKILKGAKPSDLPIEQPTKFDLVINLKTAKQLGITIPREVLYRADKIIRSQGPRRKGKKARKAKRDDS